MFQRCEKPFMPPLPANARSNSHHFPATHTRMLVSEKERLPALMSFVDDLWTGPFRFQPLSRVRPSPTGTCIRFQPPRKCLAVTNMFSSLFSKDDTSVDTSAFARLDKACFVALAHWLTPV